MNIIDTLCMLYVTYMLNIRCIYVVICGMCYVNYVVGHIYVIYVYICYILYL